MIAGVGIFPSPRSAGVLSARQVIAACIQAAGITFYADFGHRRRGEIN